MSNKYESLLSPILDELDHLDEKRERIIALTRKLNRTSGRGIAKIVKNENPDSLLKEARNYMVTIAEIMSGISSLLSWNTSLSGTEEYGEFEILNAIVTNKSIPNYVELKVPSFIWLGSLCDVIGELRRIVLNNLINNDLDHAKFYLHEMQEIFYSISGLDFSKSILPNLRRKIDAGRQSVERTESDVVNSMMSTKTKLKNGKL